LTKRSAPSARGDGRITEEGIAELRARIGKNLANLSRRALVTQEWIDRYALGIGDPNPLWTDPVYGTTTKYGTTIAPPSMVFNLGGADVGTGLPGVHSMYTGLEVDWYRPIRPGDDLTAHGYVKSVEEKQTAFAGRAVLQASETVFEDQARETVAKLRHFLLRTERSSARERKTVLENTLASYTDETLAEIERRILRQITRGDHDGRGRMAPRRVWRRAGGAIHVHPRIRDDMASPPPRGCHQELAGLL
jgi:acyl dehydratase